MVSPRLRMKTVLLSGTLIGAGLVWAFAPSGLDRVQNIVVIYAENRSFDMLYGSFPGAHGLTKLKAPKFTQLDRDGSVLKELPPIWMGLTATGVKPPVTAAQTEHLPNHPFGIDDPRGLNTPASVITRDLVHRFY